MNHPWRGLKEIPHNIWILSFATLINRSGMMVLPFLTLYMTKEIHVGAGKAGMVLMFFGIGSLITGPFSGKLSDRFGALRMMKLSLILSGLMLFVYPFISNFYLILLYTLVWSMVGEAFRPANLSLISTEVKPEQRKTAFALNRLAINLGMSIGPVVGGFLSTLNFDLLFYVDGITSILAGIFLIISRFDKHEEQISDTKNELETKHEMLRSRSIFRDKVFLLFMISIIPVNMVFFQHIGALPIYIVRDLGHKEFVFGLLSAINTVMIIFIEVPLNNAMAHWSDKKSITLGALLTGIGFGAMAISGNIFFIMGTIVIWTFGEMIFFPACASYAAEISPEAKRGEYMGYFQMTFSSALMLGPWIGTEVLDLFSSTILWSGTFFFGLLSASMIFYLKPKQKMNLIIKN